MDDLRVALRTLRRAPAYTLTVILALALGHARIVSVQMQGVRDLADFGQTTYF